MEYKSTTNKVYTNMRNVGIYVHDLHTYFSHSFVKYNYGISNIEIIDDIVVVFTVVDEKKFLMKVLQYAW